LFTAERVFKRPYLIEVVAGPGLLSTPAMRRRKKREELRRRPKQNGRGKREAREKLKIEAPGLQVSGSERGRSTTGCR